MERGGGKGVGEGEKRRQETVVCEAYLLRCLNRKMAVLKLTGGSEYSSVTRHWSLASGSDKPGYHIREVTAHPYYM